MITYENKVIPWTAPDPFIVSFPNGGEIHFYKNGRTVGKLSNPDDAAKEFVKFVEHHYRAHIEEAERRAEQRVRAEIGRDSDRLDWLAAQILRVRARAPYQPIIINGTYDPGELRDAIDADREVG